MKKLSVLFLTAFLAFAAPELSMAQSAELQIGFVNPQAVLARMPEMRAVQQRIQNFAEQKQQELLAQDRAFQQAFAEYQSKAGVISEAANQREQERLAEMQQELIEAQQNAEEALQRRREELLGPLFQQIGTAIDAVAQNMGLSYVLNTTTSTGDLIILYASEEFQAKYDITEAVMKELGIF